MNYQRYIDIALSAHSKMEDAIRQLRFDFPNVTETQIDRHLIAPVISHWKLQTELPSDRLFKNLQSS